MPRGRQRGRTVADYADQLYYYTGGKWLDPVSHKGRDREELDEGQQIHWSDLNTSDYHRTNRPLVVPGAFGYSDYSGSLVEKSNLEVFLEEFGERPGVFELYGSHGSRGLALYADVDDEEILDALSAVADYPVLNDDHHSNLEMEAQEEAWEQSFSSDFSRACEQAYGINMDDVSGEALREIFEQAREDANEYWVNEQGDQVWINLDPIVANVDPDALIEAGGVAEDEDED